MQQENSTNKQTLDELTVERQNTSPQAATKPHKITYNNLKACVDQFFNDTDYQTREAYKRGFTCNVGEDFTNVDMLCNLYDIVYNYITTDPDNTLTKTDKINYKMTSEGIKNITQGMSQFNDKQLDRVLISTLIGYMLKITRNYFHD